jgi:MAPEG family
MVYFGPLVVTLVYIGIYYAKIGNQAFVKIRLARVYQERGERFDRYFTTDRTMLAADRYVGNMLEQMPPFLVLLWLNAVFIDPRSATIAGSVYLVSRAAYPFFMGRELGRGVPNRILVATVAGYVVIAYFSARLIWLLAHA